MPRSLRSALHCESALHGLLKERQALLAEVELLSRIGIQRSFGRDFRRCAGSLSFFCISARQSAQDQP